MTHNLYLDFIRLFLVRLVIYTSERRPSHPKPCYGMEESSCLDNYRATVSRAGFMNQISIRGINVMTMGVGVGGLR